MLVFQRVPDMAIDIAIGMAMIPRSLVGPKIGPRVPCVALRGPHQPLLGSPQGHERKPVPEANSERRICVLLPHMGCFTCGWSMEKYGKMWFSTHQTKLENSGKSKLLMDIVG